MILGVSADPLLCEWISPCNSNSLLNAVPHNLLQPILISLLAQTRDNSPISPFILYKREQASSILLPRTSPLTATVYDTTSNGCFSTTDLLNKRIAALILTDLHKTINQHSMKTSIEAYVLHLYDFVIHV